MAAALTACETAPPAPSAANYASGSYLDGRLQPDDRTKLAMAFVTAMDGPDRRTTAEWAGERAEGSVESRDVFLRADAGEGGWDVPAPAGVDTSLPFSHNTEMRVMDRTAKAFLGPRTGARVADTLPVGADVVVLGSVADGDWLLVARSERVIGYIPSDAAVRADEDELEALGTDVALRYCRKFSQRLTVGRKTDVWLGEACQGPGGVWALEVGGDEAAG
ncbi:MAG: hypothetical protein AAF527_02220 [Pseudomonadota bacterium]